MKDFYDVWMLARTTEFDGRRLSAAIQQTFERRQTALPESAPFHLSDIWAADERTSELWRAFLDRNTLADTAPTFDDVVAHLRDFLTPPTSALRADNHFALHWPAGGPWLARPSES